MAKHPERSELMRRITHPDPEQRMPPQDSKRVLTALEVDLLRRWIEQGAPWQEHWAFEKLIQPSPPQLAEENWLRNPIDHFVLKRLR